MKKTLLLVLAMLMALTPFASAEGNSDQMADAVKSFQAFELNGEKVEIGGYLINGNNYYKLRDVAALLNSTTGKFDVKYENKKISLKTGEAYEKLETDLQPMKHDKTKAKMVTNKIMVDGKDVELNAAFIDNNNYVKLRDLGTVVGLEVDFKDGTIIVNTKAEGKTEENIEEKKEEKKDEAKSTDPNLTFEEIKALLEDEKKAGNLVFNYFHFWDDTLDHFKATSKDGVIYLDQQIAEGGLRKTVSRYELLDKEANHKKIAEQSEIFAKTEVVKFYTGNSGKIYFVNAESFGQESIDILSIVKDFDYKTDKGKAIGLGIDKMALLAPSKDNKNNRVLGSITVSAKYSDGSEIKSSEEKPVTEIPLFNGNKKAKLSSLQIEVTLFNDILLLEHQKIQQAFVYVK